MIIRRTSSASHKSSFTFVVAALLALLLPEEFETQLISRSKLELFNAICQKWPRQTVTFVMPTSSCCDRCGDSSCHDSIIPLEIMQHLSRCNYLAVQTAAGSSCFNTKKNNKKIEGIVSKTLVLVPVEDFSLFVSRCLDTGALDQDIWFLPALEAVPTEFLLQLRLDSQVYGKYNGYLRNYIL